MASDGDKIAAAMLAAELMRAGVKGHSEQTAVELYGDLLKEIAVINPDTGRAFTPGEVRQLRNGSQIY